MTSKTARRAALALAGLAVTGGAVVGMAGTAQATAPSTHSGHYGGGYYGWGGDEDEVVAVFGSRRQCEWAGRVGEYRGYWEDYDCDFLRTGYRGYWKSQWGNNISGFWQGDSWRYRGVWVLRAEDCD
ncbi:hypothetical protein [Cryptosporangium phraense]|uniref:Uncharacterized protein n=1 Tax=Cryptosporangium phraense TaxID=2593070 RepID=A0A545AEH5_9ACTN|nr:hypothetical protein [Cryptosporangium phraense]TQS39722.1 hypothetical protein FL583_38530 [Cryptosporangium phraense]